MYKTFRLLCCWSLVALLSSGFFLACSNSTDECQSTGDCKTAKGENYICSVKPDGKKCVLKSTTGDCDPACTGTQKCVDGKCVACSNDTDCAPDETCKSGTCEKKATTGCSPACATGDKCVNGKCVQCDQNSDCKTGEKCESNKCVADTTGCNPPCTGTDKCVNNQCVQCAQDSDCPTGQTCNANKCEQKPACNPPCAANEQCVNSKCVQCTKDTECASDETCNTTTGKCEKKATGCNPPCTSGEKCVNNQCVQCEKDADCASDETCNTTTGKCEKKATGCNPPCASGEKCVNNQCVQCENNTDCASGEKCVSNKCVQCENNGDCAASEKCDAGKCVPNTLQCNPPCQPGEQCVSGKCVECTSNSDCSSGNTCVNGRCTQQTTCTSNSDCTGGNICSNGVCVSPVGSPCGSSPTQTCPTGYQCLIIDSQSQKAVCFQDCSSNQNACAGNTTDGRTDCVTVGTSQSTNQPIRVCLKTAKKGDSCGAATWVTTAQALCDGASQPPLYCNKADKCAEYQYRTKSGETCNKQNDTTEPRYLCDPKSQLVCSESSGTCVTAKIAKEGEPCDQQGTVLGAPTICDPTVTDLICVTFDQSGSLARCQRRCDPQKAGQCSHNSNLTCWQVFTDGGGMCFDITCSQDSDCAFSNYGCQTNPLGGTGKVCWPKPPVGPKAYGESCGSPIASNGCKTGVTCLQTNDESGYCTQDCTNTTCPTTTDASGKTIQAKCETFGSGVNTFKRCVFPCGTTGQTCPKELTECQEVQNSSGSNIKICTVPPPVGPNGFGAICSSPTSTKGCKKDLFCLKPSTATNGYCSRDCTTDNTCPSFTDGAGKTFTPTCQGGLSSGNNKLCVILCTPGSGANCPKDTQCTTVGTTSICLAQ